MDDQVSERVGSLGLGDLLGLSSVSESILLLSSDSFKVSASSSSSRVSSDVLDGPGVSSLLIVNTSTGGSVSSFLLMEV